MAFMDTKLNKMNITFENLNTYRCPYYINIIHGYHDVMNREDNEYFQLYTLFMRFHQHSWIYHFQTHKYAYSSSRKKRLAGAY